MKFGVWCSRLTYGTDPDPEFRITYRIHDPQCDPVYSRDSRTWIDRWRHKRKTHICSLLVYEHCHVVVQLETDISTPLREVCAY